MSNKIAVVGGINTDISGTSYDALRERDSNPGKVSISPGGVGRNIAENLALLGFEVELICALGSDEFALMHERFCQKRHIGLKYAVRVPGRRSDIYICVNEPSGEMRLAVSDTESCSLVTPEYLARCMDFINCCDICVLDANISRESIEFLASYASVPLFLDPVSAAKAAKAGDFIGSFHTVKPNRVEAGMLSGADTSTEEGLFAAADSLLSKGVRRVFISLGEEGILYADSSNRGKAPPVPGKVVNTTGAGDAATAALAWGWIKGLSISECAKAACRASALALECESAVNGMMSEEAIHPGSF